jgi:tRNA threonylcarbamoyl adenosine modification protein YeaZ
MPETSVLVIETSTPAASLAFIDATGAVDQEEFNSDRSHNALLFPPLQQLIGREPAGSIRLVLAGSGPGSYSGTRVGLSAAQGVALAHGCPAIAFPSILALPQAENGAAYLVIGDARRGSFWTSQVENFRLEAEPTLTDASGLQDAIAAAISAGQPIVSFEDPARFPLEDSVGERVRLGFPSAKLLWRAWNETDEETRAHWAAAVPQPMYLKPPHITPAKRSWLVKKP